MSAFICHRLEENRKSTVFPTSSAGNYTGYDKLGRATSSFQQTDGQNYGFTYGYNLASEMTSQTYPSGRVVQTEYDAAGRLAGVKNQIGLADRLLVL